MTEDIEILLIILFGLWSCLLLKTDADNIFGGERLYLIATRPSAP
jgi:hypothetical protein